MRNILFLIMIITTHCSCSVQKISKSQAHTPDCIKTLISGFSIENGNPPRNIYSYVYEGVVVYYLPAPHQYCADCFSDLYDSNCNLIAHPDGGITGKGDGRAKDFFQKRTNEKIIWKYEPDSH